MDCSQLNDSDAKEEPPILDGLRIGDDSPRTEWLRELGWDESEMDADLSVDEAKPGVHRSVLRRNGPY